MQVLCMLQLPMGERIPIGLPWCIPLTMYALSVHVAEPAQMYEVVRAQQERTVLVLRCQMWTEWSSEPLMIHFPFWSVVPKLAKMQCLLLTWPAQPQVSGNLTATHETTSATH